MDTPFRTALGALPLPLLLGGLLLAAPAAAQTCSFAAGPDVIVGELTGPSNYASENGIAALAVGTTSCNLGDQLLDWIANTPQHPVIGQNLYRLKDYGGWWAMEQVGMSWLKHGFAALQGGTCCTNCTSSPDGAHLGVGCSDPYGSGLNGSQSGLGPRWQVNPYTGAYTYPPANPGWSGSVARRLQVAIADLEPTGSTTTHYYAEGHYVTPDDAAAGNQDNNASYREMVLSGGGSSWTFSFTGVTHRQSSAIEAWADSGVDPNVHLVDFKLTGEGRYVLGYSVTDLGNGTWHYEYALYNMNSYASVSGFRVPMPVGVSLTNVGFHDVTYRNGDGIGSVDRDGTDWTFGATLGYVRWSSPSFLQNPNSNALRWGTTYNFRFDASTPPRATDIMLTRYMTGELQAVSAVAPSAPMQAFGQQFCNASDGSLAACPCANPGGSSSGCDNAQSTGGVFLEATAFNPDGSGGGTATFTATGFNPAGNPSYVLLRSTTQQAATAAFDGVLCLGAPVVRVGSGSAAGGTATEAYTHGSMASPGLNLYQLWYRSTPMSYCNPAEASNLSNGYSLTW
jgi:hypothetical protein